MRRAAHGNGAGRAAGSGSGRARAAAAVALGLACALAAGCAGRDAAPAAGAAAPMPRGDGATLHYQCADGVRVDVQPLMENVPELSFNDGPVEVRFGGASHVLRPVDVASGMRYESARIGWEWFGKGDQAVLRDMKTSTLLARDCRRMPGGDTRMPR